MFQTVVDFSKEEVVDTYLEEQLLTGRSVVGRISYGDLPVEVLYLVE